MPTTKALKKRQTTKAAEKANPKMVKRERGIATVSLVSATKVLATYLLMGSTKQSQRNYKNRFPPKSEKAEKQMAEEMYRAYFTAAEQLSQVAYFETAERANTIRGKVAREYCFLRYLHYGFKKNILRVRNAELMNEAISNLGSRGELREHYSHLYSVSKNNDEAEIDKWKAKMKDAAKDMWRKAVAHMERAAERRDRVLAEIFRVAEK